MSSTMTKTTLFAAMLAMASTTSAHMFLESPVPFAGVQKTPLDPSGSNFPCQVGAGGAYTITSMNEWTVGSDVTVSFPADQTATHGGGSCQISVTKDKEPTPQSEWKVIHSIEGGCPTTGSGNSGPLGTFPFKVPAALPEGQLTMAWTWFNKVGNREMYMNCAPIKVSGGTGKGFDKLPNMAIANVAAQGSTCKTSEGSDFTFANPGESVAKLGTGPFKELCGGAASEGAASTPATPPSGGDSAPAAPASPKPVTPTPAAPAAPKAPATGGSAGSSTCSEHGALMCNGESQFGICSNGQAIYQSVAAGTKCSNGKIARRDYTHRHQRTAI